jgi:glutamyl-tRNA reductase
MPEAVFSHPGPAMTVFGVDHHRTPVAVRERLALGAERVPELVGRLRELLPTGEAVVLSTCNRFEIYISGSHSLRKPAEVVAALGGVEVDLVVNNGYIHHGTAGVRHLFRVASGLESLVLGEEQIVHQVKQAYETAYAAGWTGGLLNPLFQRALGVAKDVRTNTALSRHKLSVASVAVDLARQVHGDLQRARLLVLGAGEMAELAVRYLHEHGVRSISIVNRSTERALALAETAEATVLPWSDLGRALAEHDIVVASTSAPHTVVSCEEVRRAMGRRRTPLVLIDLAVPRDIDAAVGELDDCYLYNIDHLERVVAANRQLRTDEVEHAEARVDEQVRSFVAMNGGDTPRLLIEVAGFFKDVVETEATRLADRLDLQGADARGEVRYGVERATAKLTHRIHAYLRAHPGDAEAEQMVRELLGLNRK